MEIDHRPLIPDHPRAPEEASIVPVNDVIVGLKALKYQGSHDARRQVLQPLSSPRAGYTVRRQELSAGTTRTE